MSRAFPVRGAGGTTATVPAWGVYARSGLSSPLPGVVPGSGGRKRIRTAPSDRGPSRRQRTRPPLSTGRPDPFPSPTPRPAGAVCHPVTAPGRKTAGCKRPPPRCGPDRGGPEHSGQPARVWTVAATYRLSHRCQPPGTSPSRHPPDTALATRRRRCRPRPHAVQDEICRRTVMAAAPSASARGKRVSAVPVARNSPVRWFIIEIFSSNVDPGEDYPLHLASGRPA